MSQDTRIYEPLGPDEIRLFELQPGPNDSPIQGILRKYRLPCTASSSRTQPPTDENGHDTTPYAPEYSALSYTWGTSPPGPTVHLFPPPQPQSEPPSDPPPGEPLILPIKPNLHAALLRLRQDIPPSSSSSSPSSPSPSSPSPPLPIWIDALCIHQPNTREKNAQVSKMAQIYNLAATVRVWLGPASATSARAIRFIQRLQRIEDFDFVVTQGEGDRGAGGGEGEGGVVGDWEALHELMNRAWFSRRWIVQEISLARRAVLYCGGHGAVEWAHFAAATALFAARHRELGKLFRGSEAFGHMPNYLGEMEGLGAKSLVDITMNLFRKNEEGVVLERLLSLEALISTLTLFEAASPHDIIFSVLWLSADAEPDARESGAFNFDPLVRTPTQSPEIDVEATQLDTQLQSQLPWDQGHRWHSPENEHLDNEEPNPPNTQDYYALPATQYSQMPPPSQHANAPRRRNTFLKPPAPRHISTEPARSASDISKLTAELEFTDQPHALNVDYDKDVYEVYKQFLEFAMNRSRSLDILCHPWAPELPSLPSWIPKLSSAPFERKPGSNAFARVRADSLVGRPGLVGSRTYNASGKTKLYPPKGFIQGRTLIVTGFVLDAIKVRKSPAVEGIIPSSWLDLVDWTGPPDPVPEKFWRTLCADRGADGQKYPPAYFANACSYVYSKRSRRGNLNTTEMLNYGNCPSIAAEFLRRVQEVIWDRMLVLTEGRKGSKKLLALVPAEAEEGDLISIIYGCSVPVVLRRQKKRKAADDGGRYGSGYSTPISSTEALPRQTASLSRVTSNATLSDVEGRTSDREPPRSVEEGNISALPENLDSPHQYTFVGECFVHGMMGGEGFKHQSDHKNKIRAFHIV